ncbi:hypothetical protein BDQ12DRAFT_616846 [Crucibulum laeve]|uniref:DUF6534 domain-containing protein n=1 Tax=Crucibulum laeve TaxID=68775 RepID=A0A5C3LUZ8_9AGAR|nr:hypothetical protein BDQ12DRAFT_616846 [Crucibulum laeve]
MTLVDSSLMTMDIANTYGALLVGVLFAIGLSGIVAVQIILYFKLYLKSKCGVAVLILIVYRVLDFCHSGFICAAMWDYFIINFGNASEIDSIPLWVIILSVLFTAILTLFVHRCAGIHYISCTISIRVPRIVSSLTGSIFKNLQYELWHLLPNYVSWLTENWQWVFSVGLALSSAADIWVTLSLFFLLRSSRSRSLSLDHIIDSLILYTLEIGTLTCLVTIISMIFWVTMHNNLIFLAFHVTIEKCESLFLHMPFPILSYV